MNKNDRKYNLFLKEYNDIRPKLINLLKTKPLKKLLDTDERRALYDFNSFRNSLIHSSNEKSFIYMTEEYFEVISEMLFEVDNVFSFLLKEISTNN